MQISLVMSAKFFVHLLNVLTHKKFYRYFAKIAGQNFFSHTRTVSHQHRQKILLPHISFWFMEEKLKLQIPHCFANKTAASADALIDAQQGIRVLIVTKS